MLFVKWEKNPCSITAGNRSQITVFSCVSTCTSNQCIPLMNTWPKKRMRPRLAYGEVPGFVYVIMGLAKRKDGWFKGSICEKVPLRHLKGPFRKGICLIKINCELKTCLHLQSGFCWSSWPQSRQWAFTSHCQVRSNLHNYAFKTFTKSSGEWRDTQVVMLIDVPCKSIYCYTDIKFVQYASDNGWRHSSSWRLVMYLRKSLLQPFSIWVGKHYLDLAL